MTRVCVEHGNECGVETASSKSEEPWNESCECADIGNTNYEYPNMRYMNMIKREKILDEITVLLWHSIAVEFG